MTCANWMGATSSVAFSRCPSKTLRVITAGVSGPKLGEEDFRRYLALYSEDASGEPPVRGALANAISRYKAALGLPISIQFGDATSRPSVHVSLSTGHMLAAVQAAGMTHADYHDILVSTGALGGP